MKYHVSLKTNPLVTVVLVNYNYGRFLDDSITSVLSQSYSNLELIIVDDGSSDNSREIVTKYNDSRITFVSIDNSGVSNARNKGVCLSRGSLLAFLDADDYWHPMKLEIQIQVMNNFGVDIVYCGVQLVNEVGIEQEILRPRFAGNLYKHYLRRPGQNFILLGASSALILTEKLNQIRFHRGLSNSADWEFFASLSESCNVSYSDAPLVSYRKHNANMSTRSVNSHYIQAFKAYGIFISKDWKIHRNLIHSINYIIGISNLLVEYLKSQVSRLLRVN